MPLLMKNTSIGRRAYAVSQHEADALVASGDAVQDGAHSGIYEEVTEGERDQGYMTRTMTAIPTAQIKRKPGRPAKNREEPVAEVLALEAPAEGAE
jgi:hypothetical protein